MKLVIGNCNYSSWSLRAWLAMRVADIAFEEELIPLSQPDSAAALKARSPSGLAPCLIEAAPGGGAPIVVWETLAILEHLAERFPDRGLWPEDLAARAHARAVSAEMHAGFAALREVWPMNVRRHVPGYGRTPEVLAQMRRIEAIWAECRARFGEEGPFLFGRFSAADAMYAPVASRFKTYAAPIAAVSQEYVDAIHALPAMAEWTARAQAETWVIAHEDVGP